MSAPPGSFAVRESRTTTDSERASRQVRLGIDVGGTNTDAVVIDSEDRLLAQQKVPTTADITGGIRAAIASVLGVEAIAGSNIACVMLGTTHAANAVLERRNLRRVAVIRIGGPATRAIPPLATWPDDLLNVISAGEIVVDGGIEFNGEEFTPLDSGSIARFLDNVAGQVDAVAITSVFAAVSEAHEVAAASLARRILGDVHVSLSHEIGTLGLLERENATVLNAALIGVSAEVTRALESALRAHDLDSAVYLTQNDGTLMLLDYALRYPVLTIWSGQANSICGAAYLSGLDDALVIDVGGTTIDVGMLISGLPKDSSSPHEIGGVVTNFPIPDFVSLPVGGGSVIARSGGSILVGPRSVGYRLAEEALVFGGRTATVTDAAVAAGRHVIGDQKRAARQRKLLSAGLAAVDRMIAAATDTMKLSRTNVPLVVVGGGGFIVPDTLPGVTDVIRPNHHEVANAVGAAIASVGGQVDRVVDLTAGSLGDAVDAARNSAVARAIRAGADPRRIRVIHEERIPLAYLTNPTARIRIKVAGSLASLDRRLA
ncbi:MAG TPA: hydantoinase/oxoprolinase family protein [Vicinamibacterales bacterium]|nr:hydantoinase/oxoprolinase family protein [Vicinamibacterales bacterium]